MADTEVKKRHGTTETKEVAGDLSVPATNDKLEEEMKRMHASPSELRRGHLISVFYFLLSLLVVTPVWWITTVPEQHDLPESDINRLSSSPLNLNVAVFITNFDAWLTSADIKALEMSLTNTSAEHQALVASERSRRLVGNRQGNVPVDVTFSYHAVSAKPDEMQIYNQHLNVPNVAAVSAEYMEKELMVTGAFSRTDSDGQPLSRSSIASAYHFIVLPHDSKFWRLWQTVDKSNSQAADASPLLGLIRHSTEQKIVYLRSPCASQSSASSGSCKAGVEQLQTSVLALLEQHFVVPTKLQMIYESVWWAGQKVQLKDNINSGADNIRSSQESLAKARTHQLPPSGGYDVVVTLVAAYAEGHGLPLTDNWLATRTASGLSLGEWLRLTVEPGLLGWMRHLRINLYSQYLYGVNIEGLKRSRPSKDKTHRLYSQADMSRLLNSLEAYLGTREAVHHGEGFAVPNPGLHIVLVLGEGDEGNTTSSTNTPLPVRFDLTSKLSRLVIVPQWGGLISLDKEGDVKDIGPALVGLVNSLMGAPSFGEDVLHLSGIRGVFTVQHSNTFGELSRLQLDAWLRLRTIESLSTTSLTLTSLVYLMNSVPNMVIRPRIAKEVHRAVDSWENARIALQCDATVDAVGSQDCVATAFQAAKRSLKGADGAFFDHTLLDLLYFPADQKFGIYLPLFAPIGIPIVSATVLAFKYFKKAT